MNLSRFYCPVIALAAMTAETAAAPPAAVTATETRAENSAVTVTGVSRLNPTTVELSLSNGKRIAVDFYLSLIHI